MVSPTADPAAAGTADPSGLTFDELQLATRNHGMPLEALRYDLTPVGLHYLLIHYDIPVIDPVTWRLDVGGLVSSDLELSLDDLRQYESVTTAVTMECAGNGRARLNPREVVFTGADRGVEGGTEQSYQRSLRLDEATRRDVLLAHQLNGQPLPPQHGAPVRLVVPGWYGMTNVKWLTSIRVVDTPFDGYQQTRAYQYRTGNDDAGTPVERMVVRSLLVPPGIPDFLTRERRLRREHRPSRAGHRRTLISARRRHHGPGRSGRGRPSASRDAAMGDAPTRSG